MTDAERKQLAQLVRREMPEDVRQDMQRLIARVIEVEHRIENAEATIEQQRSLIDRFRELASAAAANRDLFHNALDSALEGNELREKYVELLERRLKVYEPNAIAEPL